MAKLLALLAVVVVAAPAYAEPDIAVGLYRLDTDKKLDIYGQAFATELARSLQAAGVEALAIGPNEKTPDNVKVIVGGKLEARGSGFVVTVTVHTLAGDTAKIDPVSEPAITNIDRATGELTKLLVPVLQEKIAAVREAEKRKQQQHPQQDPVKQRPALPATKVALVAVVASGAPTDEPLRAALVDSVTPWTQKHGRDLRLVDPKSLSRELAAKTIAASNTDLGILLEVAELVIEPGDVPMAHARVKVRIADGQNVLFDRTVVTDTVVGDKGMATAPLVARAARAVLAIIAPTIHRKVSGWRAGD